MRSPCGNRLWPIILFLAYVPPAFSQQQSDKLSEIAAAAGAVASSFDVDGVPRFLWVAGERRAPAGARADAAARLHLEHFARAYNVSDDDVASTEILEIQAAGNRVIAHMRQRVNGVVVHGSDVRVLMRNDLRLIAISGRLRAIRGSKPDAFVLSAEAALAGALSHLFGLGISASNVVPAPAGDPLSTAQRFQLSNASLHMSEPASVSRVLYPSGPSLVAAYVIEFYAAPSSTSDSLAYRYVIAADDGRVLDRRDLTVTENDRVEFDYRVFAETAGGLRPLDGPQSDFTPHPTGTPDGSGPTFILPNLVSVHGLNQQPSPLADPWLSATATETRGNNADAYVDHRPPDGLTPAAGDFRAQLTGPRSFDRVYNTALDPLASVDQSQAAITNAFYTVNWLHDYWYDSGFNEAAGNAQRDNYGRGGLGGDDMRVEVQDNYFGGSRNNANMSTPSDGLRPRMQMFVWQGAVHASLTLTPGGTRAVGTASFGPRNFDVTAFVVLANDGVGTLTDACQPLSAIAGRIVLVDRGTCTFVDKARNVQAGGGLGIIVANNVAGPAPGLGGTDPTITIAVLSISLTDGNLLKSALVSGPVTARMFRSTDVDRDSALDNLIVAHEWGHYLHHRLADCGTQQCGALSEGWGDFVALHTMARAGDNLDGTFAGSIYAGGGFDPNVPYFGVRRVPYSVDFTRNALTLKHISDGEPLPPVPTLPGGPNSEVHNAGEVWASMMWEAYVALQKAAAAGQTFDDVRRRMADYVVAGLQMTPRDATYTEQRDAILAAALAARPDSDAADPDDLGAGGSDVIVLANAFARRGAGTCAIAPPRNSLNLVGVTESYDLRPRIGLGSIRVELAPPSCDADGFLDAAERGRIVMPLLNGGPVEMVGTNVSFSSSIAGLTFPAGSSATVSRLAPFSSTEITIPVELSAGFSGIGRLEIGATASADAACVTSVTRIAREFVNVNEVLNSSRIDTVESPTSAWTSTGARAADVWSRVEAAPFDLAWLGIDLSTMSDTQLVSPALQVSATAPLVITLSHRHSFERDGTVLFDGGVIEVSRDGGATWQDITTYGANPGYGGTLFVGSGNPLGGRQARVGTNASWPAPDTLTLNLGMALAGQTIRIRFRIGTDAAVGDFGWQLDNLSFEGITNTPFATLVADATPCRRR